MAVMEVSKKEKTLQEKERKNLFKDFLLIDVPIQSFRGNIYTLNLTKHIFRPINAVEILLFIEITGRIQIELRTTMKAQFSLDI